MFALFDNKPFIVKDVILRLGGITGKFYVELIKIFNVWN